ncbi:MAG: hypothetical protein CM15mP74_30950 [Halieaceae bacterium]|nr:MAG: hypothetical protein CM15mP74_30950 [Halieaceae bacterium]
MRMTEIIHDVAPGRIPGVLTGPNLAREIVAGQAAASVWRLRITRPRSRYNPSSMRGSSVSIPIRCDRL